MDSSIQDPIKVAELKRKVKELEDENVQLALKLQKTNRNISRLRLERQYFILLIF